MFGIVERWGLVHARPRGAARAPVRGPGRRGRRVRRRLVAALAHDGQRRALVADNFLDVAHFPFVHAGHVRAGTSRSCRPYDVIDEPNGFRSIQVQWFDNPADPGVAAGLRPVRQRRRATYVYRAPFQLLLRLEELDAGAVKTILFFAQPETLTSTRMWTKMLLHGIGGVEPSPGPEVVAREVAFEEAVLAEDLALQR